MAHQGTTMAAFPTVEDDVHDSSISFGPDRDARKVDGFRAFREAGEFYQSVCRPEFEKLCVPGFLIRELSGSDKFFNRCARRGLVRLVEVDGGHGAFLLKPNCAYHDLLECALRKQRKCEEGADAEIAETLLGLADDPDPFGVTLRFDEGFAFIAWWLAPELCPQARALLAELASERPRDQPDLTVFVGMQRQPSSYADQSTFGSVSSHARGAGYLHNMREVKSVRDVALLEALLQLAPAWLQEVLGAKPDSLHLHYPYHEGYSTLHVHLRTYHHPNMETGSSRTCYALRDLIGLLKAQGRLDGVDFTGILPTKDPLKILETIAAYPGAASRVIVTEDMVTLS